MTRHKWMMALLFAAVIGLLGLAQPALADDWVPDDAEYEQIADVGWGNAWGGESPLQPEEHPTSGGVDSSSVSQFSIDWYQAKFVLKRRFVMSGQPANRDVLLNASYSGWAQVYAWGQEGWGDAWSKAEIVPDSFFDEEQEPAGDEKSVHREAVSSVYSPYGTGIGSWQATLTQAVGTKTLTATMLADTMCETSGADADAHAVASAALVLDD